MNLKEWQKLGIEKQKEIYKKLVRKELNRKYGGYF